MIYVDAALLNFTEWCCRRFQVLTGRTNVWLAVQLTNLSIIVYFIWAGMYFWSSDVGSRTALGLFCGGLLYVLSQTLFKVPIEEYEHNASFLSDAVNRAVLPNPVRVHPPPAAHRASQLLPHRPDDGGAVPGGVRSAAAVRRDGAGAAARIGSITAGGRH
jgi:hypothetical protein